MIQPKYSPKEALEKMKLLMKYDTSKTLNENVEVIKEQISDNQLDVDVETMIDLLDFPVSEGDLSDAFKLIKKYESDPRGKDFLEAYQMAGLGGGSLRKTLQYVWTTGSGTTRKKKAILDIVEKIEGVSTYPTPQPTATNTTPVPNPTGGTPVPVPVTTPLPRTSRYTSCSETFPIAQFCKNSVIGKVQGCLGITADNAFGPKTQAALEAKGLPGTQITQNSVDTACGGGGTTPFTDLGGSADSDDMG